MDIFLHISCKKPEFRFEILVWISFSCATETGMKENKLAKQLYLDLIRFMVGWSLYLSIIPEIVFSSKERIWIEKFWLFDIFKIEIFMKYSLKVLAISTSSDRILSSSTRVILERILTLSEIFGLTIFQKIFYLPPYWCQGYHRNSFFLFLRG